jgi:hypothetical protein
MQSIYTGLLIIKERIHTPYIHRKFRSGRYIIQNLRGAWVVYRARNYIFHIYSRHQYKFSPSAKVQGSEVAER